MLRSIQLLCANCHLEKTRLDVSNPSQEMRANWSEKRRGRKQSEATKTKRSESLIEFYADPKNRVDQSDRLMGHEVTEATRAKISNGHIGIRHTDVIKQKIRESIFARNDRSAIAYLQAMLGIALLLGLKGAAA